MSEINTFISYICKGCSQLFSFYNTDIVNNENISDNCALNTIICYSKFSNDMTECTNTIYNSSDTMHCTCDYVAYSFKYVSSILFWKQIEPMYPNWIRVSVVRFHNKYEYNCNYYCTAKLENNIDFCRQFTQYSKKIYFDLLKNKNPIISIPWYSMKYTNDEQYFMLSRINNSINAMTANAMTKFEKSAIRFLLIEYTHPTMKENLQIEINSSWYMVGNELFSFAMILHLLENQNEKYIFDKNYTIYIMDTNINTFELKYNEYILLNKYNFQILS